MTACNMVGGPLTGSGSTDSSKLSPGSLSYSSNPASYPYGSAISSNVLSGSGSITAVTISPSLPAGLTLNATNGTISGTPTTITASTSYSVRATNAQGTSYLTLTLAITDKPPTLTYGGQTTWVYTVGTAITNIVPTLGGGTTTSCSSSPPLPAGLTLSSQCKLSGTPTTPVAATNYTISANNDGGSAKLVLNLTVKDIVPNISYAPASHTYYRGQAITAITPTNTGGAITSCSSDFTLPAGLSLSSTCRISGTPTAITASKLYTITATNSGGSATTTLTLDVQEPAPNISFSPSARSLTINQAATISVTNIGGVPSTCNTSNPFPAGLSFSANCDITGTPTVLTSGWSSTITAGNATGSSGTSITIDVNDVAPVIAYSGSPYTWNADFPIAPITPTYSGGTVTACSSSPSLPAGLSLSNLCVISGTPTTAQSATTYAITATNSGGTKIVSISIRIQTVAPNLSFSGSPYVFTNGTMIAGVTPTNTGGVITSCVSSPTLPAGLTLSSTCDISGTPTSVASATNYTVTATNAGGSSSAIVRITVKDILPSFSYAGSPFSFSTGTAIPALTANNTGGAITSCSSSPTLPAGLSLSSNCDISGTPTVSSVATNYTISGRNSGGTATTSINITVIAAAPEITYSGSPFIYTVGTAISNLSPTNTGGVATSCVSAPPLPAGLNLSNTCDLTGLPTAVAAATNYTITATNADGSSSATIRITVNDVAPLIDYIPTTYSFTYTKGTAIAPLTPNSTGGTITNCTTTPSLPAGLSIAAGSCSITGLPTAIQGSTSYTITASNTGGSSSTTIMITVNDAAPAFSYAGGPFSTTINAAMATLTPTSTGGTITSCSSSPGLPGGLSLSPTCVITGTPTSLSTATTYTITATNSGGSASTTISLAIDDVIPTLNYAGSPFTYTQGVAIANATPTNTGGTITSCSSSSTLPTGLSLSSTCVISGTPSVTSGATVYAITATNSGGSVSRNISITVNLGPPILSFSGSPFTFTRGTAITTITPSNTGGTIASCVSTPGLPAGLTLSPTCVISGTPTAASAATDYSITGTNAQGSSSYTINITVNDTPPSIGFTPSSYVEELRTAISTITPSNSGGTITSCGSNPTLPTGLNLSNTCVITGTPTAITAATDYTITATNSGGSASAIVNIQVKNQPQIVFSSFMPLNGSTNGTPTGSSNAWTITFDGTDKVALTSNTAAGLDSDNPSFSAAGTKVTFASKTALNGSSNGSATSSYNVWSVLSGGTSPSALTANTAVGLDSNSAPQFSPDGTKVVFASKMDVSGSANGTATGSYNIWIINADGTGLTHLTANTGANLDSIRPVFGSSNSIVYFASKTAQDGSDDGTATASYNVWKVNTDGTSRSPLTNYSAAGSDCQDISVSSDGTKIVYASLADIGATTSSSYNIWTMSSNGTSNTYLTNKTAVGLDSRYPRFSSDKTEIVFSSKMNVSGVASSSYNIWSMTSAGVSQTPLTTVTSAGADSLYPVFSPDDSKIAFSSKMSIGATTANSYNIWVMSSNGTSQNYLTSNTAAGLDSVLGTGRIWFAP